VTLAKVIRDHPATVEAEEAEDDLTSAVELCKRRDALVAATAFVSISCSGSGCGHSSAGSGSGHSKAGSGSMDNSVVGEATTVRRAVGIDAVISRAAKCGSSASSGSGK
jgi:hypothetical protein